MENKRITPSQFIALIIASLTMFCAMVISSLIVLWYAGLLAATSWFGILFFIILIGQTLRSK